MGKPKENVKFVSFRNKGYEEEKEEERTHECKKRENNEKRRTQNNEKEKEKEEASSGEFEVSIRPRADALSTGDKKTTELDKSKYGVTTHDERSDSDAEGGNEVPDGGWGWIVAAGGFLGQMVVNTMVSCFGILYSEFLLDLGTSATVSSWIFNLMGFMLTFSGIFVRALVSELGYRKTAYIGCLFTFVGITATAFATSPLYFMFFLSFVAGLGIGIIAPLTYAIVPYYFDKRLGFANAIMSAGVSAGQIVGPLLITYLQSQYGFKGSVLLLGAFTLHSWIGAMAFHPVEWHRKNPKASPKKKSDGPHGCALVFRILKGTLENLKLLKSPVAVIIALGGTFNVIGYINFLMLVPFTMQEAGFSIDDAAEGLTISGITNLIARLSVSIMADFSWFNMKYCYMAGTLLVVILSVVFVSLTELTTINIVMGIWGCGVGTYMALFNLVMVRYVGREKLMAELGLTCYISSVWFLSCGPILGVIRDASGNYAISIYVLASTIAITFVLYLFLPSAIAYEKKSQHSDTIENGS